MTIRIFLFILVLSCCLFNCSKTTEPDTNTVATPTFSINGGSYLTPRQVSILCETEGAVIRFTTDGTTPSTNSETYSDPVTVDSDVTIKAIAYKSGWKPSTMAVAVYDIFQADMSQIRNITAMTATPDTIYADNGLTASTIKVTVKDGEGFGVIGQVVQFSTNFGSIPANVTTDNTGIATCTFSDTGITCVALIRAIVQNFHPDSTDFIVSADTCDINVIIADVPSIQELILLLPTPQDPYPLTVDQSILVRAKAINVLNEVVPDGTIITYSTNLGFFTDIDNNNLGTNVQIAVQNEFATVYFNAGNVTGNGTITASIAIWSASRDIVVNP